MSGKSKRKARRPYVAVEKDYQFMTNSRLVTISAATLFAAQQLFQIQFGYWPEKEFNYEHAHPKADASETSSSRKD